MNFIGKSFKLSGQQHVKYLQRNMCELKFGKNKTTAIFLSEDTGGLIYIKSVTTCGFQLSNKYDVLGSMATFPRTVLCWNVSHASKINKESLSLFVSLQPKLDCLIIGKGDVSDAVDPMVLSYLQNNGILTEVAATEKAVGIYNFMINEGRTVAGAFIPPTFKEAFSFKRKIVGQQSPKYKVFKDYESTE